MYGNGCCQALHHLAAMVYNIATMPVKKATDNIAADVVCALGGATKTAAYLGVTRAAVYYWLRRGVLPKKKQAAAALILQERAARLKRPLPPSIHASRGA